jgi:hypothetical protein
MNAVVLTASPQNAADIFLLFSVLLAMPTMVWFRRSTMPFCCGEYGAVRWPTTPLLARYVVNSTDVNSPPRSVRSTHSFFPDSASARAWNCLIAAAASSLLVISRRHMYMLQSSTNRRKYRRPPYMADMIGPHRLPWTSSMASPALYFAALGNGSRLCFPAKQSSQSIPHTIFSSRPSASKPRCSNLACHNHGSSVRCQAHRLLDLQVEQVQPVAHAPHLGE